jgi:Cu+-exporting ATPase
MTTQEAPVETSVEVVGPVCGMKIDQEKASSKQDYEGQTYYFCGRSCAEKFKANPASFLTSKPKQSPEKPTAQAGGYTCPMHPEVHKDGPGDCPKCGMALEPETVSAPATKTQYTCPMPLRSSAMSQGIALSAA